MSLVPVVLIATLNTLIYKKIHKYTDCNEDNDEYDEIILPVKVTPIVTIIMRI